eukprot:m.43974 g.43974  ORF g.43974 m.43974 type:complete len:160 (+) comp6177_c0_seq2:634-1113(+)
MMCLPNDAWHEVAPGVFMGESSVATDIDLLQRTGITHVLNCCQGEGWRRVDTTEDSYPTPMVFHGISADDDPSFQLSSYFGQANMFIRDCLSRSEPGKILIHCREGVSRSATVYLAFLVANGASPEEAVRAVRAVREIAPNRGFLAQLVAYHDHKAAES